MKNLIYSSLLLVIFSITLSAPALAQEKQSDATWEETVEFIEKYGDFIKDDIHGAFDNSYISKNFQINNPTEINKCTITYEVFNKGKLDSRMTIPLSYLLEAKEFDNPTIRLVLTGAYIKRNSKEMANGWTDLIIKDVELRQRILKAFQHLAYLATEYREEQRKASGDAF